MTHFCDHTQLEPKSVNFMLLKQHEYPYCDIDWDLYLDMAKKYCKLCHVFKQMSTAACDLHQWTKL